MSDGIYHVKVVGVSHYQPAVEACSPGESVRIIHEPDNPHDEMALRVESAAGDSVGYIPRSSWLHAAIHERGRGVSGSIASVGRNAVGIVGMVVSVAICDDEVAVASYYPDRPAPEPPEGGFRYWVTNSSTGEQGATTRT